MTERGWAGLPNFSKDMYHYRYFSKASGNHENYDDWVNRMAAFGDDSAMSERLHKYITQYYFHPSTPVSSNAGIPDRGLPISCYLNETDDSKKGIFDKWTENNWLGAEGGGIGTYWGNVREIGAQVGANGKSSGIIPFIKVSDSATLAVSQGGLRRASQAVYLQDSHPEILEFIDIRRPTGDINRRSTNIHHGVVLSDDFMNAVEKRDTWDLISPKTKLVIATVDAFDLWQKILVSRVETGEPYIVFGDNVNNAIPEEYERDKMRVKMSNLCSEIVLHTRFDYTAVCCLASVNLEYWDEIKINLNQFAYDVSRFLDNVLESFIQQTEGMPGFENARKSAMYERSVGLGFMGLHSLFQRKNFPWVSPMAKGLNAKIFKEFKVALDVANTQAATLFGSCPLSYKYGTGVRNIHQTSIAPTASISTLCNGTSQGIDPRLGNTYIHKTNIGTYTQRNKYLEVLLDSLGENTEAVWKSITKHEGSVKHLEFLDDYQKGIFETAFEIPQMYIVDYANDRAPDIDQAQSVNLYIEPDEHVENVHNVHMKAWKGGLKSLYYCRSKSASRASSDNKEREIIEVDECLGCQ